MIIIFYLVIKLIIISSNIFGIWMIRKIQKNGKERIRFLYILNQHCISLVWNLVTLGLIAVPNLFSFKKMQLYKAIRCYGAIQAPIFIGVMYQLTMVMMLVDKLLEIRWNITYTVRWIMKKTKFSIFVIWLFGIIFIIISIVYDVIIKSNVEYTLFSHVVLPISMVYLIFAICSLTYIFYKFHKSRLQPAVSPHNNFSPTFWQVFKKSRFIIPAVLVVWHTLLFIIPQSINGLYYILNGRTLRSIRGYMRVLLHLFLLMQSVTCFMFEPNLKATFMKVVPVVTLVNLVRKRRSKVAPIMTIR